MRPTLTRLSFAVLAAALLLTAAPAPAEDSTTMEGSFVWSQRDHSDKLKAVFEPTGEGTWDVSFYFTFRGEPHTYTGTAEGSLTEGALKGTVQNEDKKRTWNFEGEFQDGEFNGTHEEIGRNGESYDTGTLTLQG